MSAGQNLNKRVIHGSIQLSPQLYQQTAAAKAAYQRHELRLLTDPEYAAQWAASVDWDSIETLHEDD